MKLSESDRVTLGAPKSRIKASPECCRAGTWGAKKERVALKVTTLPKVPASLVINYRRLARLQRQTARDTFELREIISLWCRTDK